MPKGWVVDLQFADELDELLMDDLYELAEGMRENGDKEDGHADKRWARPSKYDQRAFRNRAQVVHPQTGFRGSCSGHPDVLDRGRAVSYAHNAVASHLGRNCN